MSKKKKRDALEDNEEIEKLVKDIKHKQETPIDDDEMYEDFGPKDEDDEEMVKDEEHHSHEEPAQSPDDQE